MEYPEAMVWQWGFYLETALPVVKSYIIVFSMYSRAKQQNVSTTVISC